MYAYGVEYSDTFKQSIPYGMILHNGHIYIHNGFQRIQTNTAALIIKMQGLNIVHQYDVKLPYNNEYIICMLSYNGALYFTTNYALYILNDNGNATQILTKAEINARVIGMTEHHHNLYITYNNMDMSSGFIIKLAPNHTIMATIPLLNKCCDYYDKMISHGNTLYYSDIKTLYKIVDDNIVESIYGIKHNLIIHDDAFYYIDDTRHNIWSKNINGEGEYKLVVSCPNTSIQSIIFHQGILFSINTLENDIQYQLNKYILTNHTTDENIVITERPIAGMLSLGKYIYMANIYNVARIAQISVIAATYRLQKPVMRAQMLTIALVVARYGGNRDITGEIFRYF